MTQKQIKLELKKLSIAHLISLEWDYCLSSNELDAVKEYLGSTLFSLSDQDIINALDENEGRSPSEIQWSISELIKKL